MSPLKSISCFRDQSLSWDPWLKGSVPYLKFITWGISPYTEIYLLRVLSGDLLQIFKYKQLLNFNKVKLIDMYNP